MRDYSRVAPTFWTRGSGKKLRGDAEAQVVALYLLTCPASNMIGIFYLSLPTLAHETGLPLDRARAALLRVAAADIATYDEDAELVFLPEAAKYQVGQALKGDDKRIKGIERELGAFGHHVFVSRFIERYRSYFSLTIPTTSAESIEGPSKALPRPFQGPSKPSTSTSASASQEQEQTPDSRPSPEPAGSASCPDDSEAPPGQPPTEAPGAEPLTSHAAQEPRHEAISVLNDPEPADHPESPAKAPQRPGNGQSTLFALTGPQPGEPTPPREPPPDPAQEVFDEYIVHWRRTVGARRAPVLDEKRRKLVKGRIRDGFTVEELKRACAGIWRSAWHVEQKQYDFSLVLRDASHVERFMALAPVAKNAVFSAPAAPAIDPEIAATEIPESARTAAGAAAFLRSMVDNIAETGLN